MAQARVLVVGDIILDRYWHGSTRRISPEAPVPVVLVDETVECVGGAANVAANVAALGSRVTLVGLIGDDRDGSVLEQLCEEQGINADFVRARGHSTIVKLRIVSQRQQLVRLDFERIASSAHASEIVDVARRKLADCDAVIISDYAKGAVPRVKDFIELARQAGCPVIVDPKGTDFARYAGASVLTPNLHEFEAVVGRCSDESEIAAKAARLVAELGLDALLVTRGAAGMSLVQANGEVLHVAADAHEVFDVTGAGDTVCGVLATALATGSDMAAAVHVANAAAGVVVGKFGAATVTIDEIEAALTGADDERRGLVDLPGLLAACARARHRGERIVMTNGCFDILHAGHVNYLAEAKALGSRLIVAVNDDASVRRLKGAARPLNGLDARMQVLAALNVVDWVVPFSEDTPQRLVSQILPDVLVKGGDYAVDEIAGGEEVRAAGGQVVVLDYLPGYSTTGLLTRMQREPEAKA